MPRKSWAEHVQRTLRESRLIEFVDPALQTWSLNSQVNREIAFYGFGAVARAVHKLAQGAPQGHVGYIPKQVLHAPVVVGETLLCAAAMTR